MKNIMKNRSGEKHPPLLFFILLFLIFAAVINASPTFRHPKYKSTQHTNNIIPGRYLVEYSSTKNEHSNDISSLPSSLEAELQSMDNVKLGQSYYADAAASNIRPVYFKSNQHENYLLQTIADHNDVVAIYPVSYIARPKAVSEKNGRYFQQITPDITSEIQAHKMTQVDKVHNELGLMGQGVKICIIDTGVDYFHSALGGGFGPGYKIGFGADLVGDSYDPFSKDNKIPDANAPPLDTCKQDASNGHGTHVAGIIAGNDTSKGFIGVAPKATLGVWRVFGCEGGTSSEIIMKAMAEAQKAKCDVINMSLGYSAPWSEQPHAAFAQKLSSEGISVVISNGNEGEDGAFTVTDPAGAHNVLSVAAMSNSHYLGSLFSVRDTSTSKTYGPYSYETAAEAKKDIPNGKLVLVQNSQELTACNSDTIGNLDSIKGNLVLVQQGSCTITEQATRISKEGGIGLVFFNSVQDDPVQAPFKNTSIPVTTISSTSGHELVSVLKKNNNITFSIHFERNAFVFESALGHTIADFSSIGPTNELEMKPSVAAIGSNVYSTLPTNLGGWGVKSGTSMAAPYIAGAVALLRQSQANKSFLPSTLHEKLQNYGRLLHGLNDKMNLDSPLRQGAGLIQAYDAIKEPLHVSPAQIGFNDTETLSAEYKTHSLKVSNLGTSPISYNISHLTSLSVLPYGPNNTAYTLIPSMYDKFYAYASSVKVQITIEPAFVTLQPGQSEQVVVSVTLPSIDYNKKEQRMYGGYVQFRPSGGFSYSQVTVPYFGVLGSLYNLPTLDASELNLQDPEGKTYNQNDEYHFNLSDIKGTAPKVGFRLATPSRKFTIDLIDEKDEQRVGFVVPTYHYAERGLGSSVMEDLNPWRGSLMKKDDADETPFSVSPGTYKFRWSALKMFGDESKAEDWVVYTSCPIVIVAQ